MGACASRPKDLDRDLAPAPVPAEDPATPKGDNVPQEKKEGEETKKEEPLIDVSEAAAEAPKIEEVTTETKAVVEAEGVKQEETAQPAEEVKVEAVNEEPKEQQPAEDKKEVAEKPKEAETAVANNNCPFTIWPGTLAGAGTPPLPATGFRLDAGESITIPSVAGWSGRIWARTGCTFDQSGIGSCQTGDCGGKLECNGLGATPPASLFEITLGVGDNKDFYDVSIVDGYNLPMVAVPQGVNGGCNATGCLSNLNMGCPKELQVVDEYGGEGNVVACKSACEAFGLDQYCCAGQFANPTTCQPSFYSTIFKNACPRAYSYAFDDGTSTFTCKADDYAIIFCPMNGVKRPNEVSSTTTAARPIEESKNEKFAGVASSSNILLLSFPVLIHALLISSVYL
ncbi:hypothetical protein HAX54_010265 [Datura stramonium]|uniref:Uncharacterized protein n=1 Tax=Datura stramonium TaxID=4076 RepID=A0ABS8WZJ2_DATST|nr:hypothetical protein [Datura stramonium]